MATHIPITVNFGEDKYKLAAGLPSDAKLVMVVEASLVQKLANFAFLAAFCPAR